MFDGPRDTMQYGTLYTTLGTVNTLFYDLVYLFHRIRVVAEAMLRSMPATLVWSVRSFGVPCAHHEGAAILFGEQRMLFHQHLVQTPRFIRSDATTSNKDEQPEGPPQQDCPYSRQAPGHHFREIYRYGHSCKLKICNYL